MCVAVVVVVMCNCVGSGVNRSAVSGAVGCNLDTSACNGSGPVPPVVRVASFAAVACSIEIESGRGVGYFDVLVSILMGRPSPCPADGKGMVVWILVAAVRIRIRTCRGLLVAGGRRDDMTEVVAHMSKLCNNLGR